jgi:hypothetical protein
MENPVCETVQQLKSIVWPKRIKYRKKISKLKGILRVVDSEIVVCGEVDRM